VAYIAAQPKFDAAISPDEGSAIVSTKATLLLSLVHVIGGESRAVDLQVSVLAISSCNPVTHIA
jgi:hypothetical protein